MGHDQLGLAGDLGASPCCKSTGPLRISHRLADLCAQNAQLAIHATGSLKCGQFRLPNEDKLTDHSVSVGADVLARHNLVKGGAGADHLFIRANIADGMRPLDKDSLDIYLAHEVPGKPSGKPSRSSIEYADDDLGRPVISRPRVGQGAKKLGTTAYHRGKKITTLVKDTKQIKHLIKAVALFSLWWEANPDIVDQNRCTNAALDLFSPAS